MQNEIPSEYQGWWRIIETSQWINDKLDILGTAIISRKPALQILQHSAGQVFATPVLP
jgi:hypothetical protein